METFDTNARIAVLENELKNIACDLKEHRQDSKEHHRELKEFMDNLDQRLSVLERWRWMIIGGSLVIGYLIAHLMK